MKDLLAAVFGHIAVERASIVAQLVLVICGAAAFYEGGSHVTTQRLLRSIARIQNYTWLGRWGFGIGSPPRSPEFENAAPTYVFAIAAAICVATVISGHSPFYWLAYPAMQFLRGALVWRTIDIGWPLLSVPLKSVGLWLWAILSSLLIYALGVGTIGRAIALSATWVDQRLSSKTFHFMLFVASVIAGLAIIATTTNWYA